MMKKRMPKRAFTFVELIIVITIVGIVTGIGTPFLMSLFDSFGYTLFRKDISQGAEIAIRRMTREMRRLRNDTSVNVANSTTYQFIDIDGNTIEYQINGTNLQRTHSGTTDILAADVSSFQLTYNSLNTMFLDERGFLYL